MAEQPGRRTRSRKGCQQCVKVSRKCDEVHPLCSRCLRLGFACDYTPRLIWKKSAPDKRLRRNSSASLATAPVTVMCRCPSWPSDKELEDQFALQGHDLMHWTNMATSLTETSKIAILVKKYKPIRSAIHAFMATQMGCCRLFSLSRIDHTIREMRDFIQTGLSHSDLDVTLVSMLLTSQISMRAGYPWTHQLRSIVDFIVKSYPESQHNHETDSPRQRVLDMLGGLDMDVWIIGRKSEALNIWATYCCGRRGIDGITGLPRQLMDIISRLRMKNSSMVSELRLFIENSGEGHVEQIWRAFALAALLHINDVDTLSAGVAELWDVVKSLLSFEQNVNLRVLLWPAWMLVPHTRSASDRLLLEHLLSQTGQLTRTAGQYALLIAARKFWTTQDNNDVKEARCSIAESSGIVELGMW